MSEWVGGWVSECWLFLMLLASPALSATVCGGIGFPSHFAIFQKRGRATAIMVTWLQKDA